MVDAILAGFRAEGAYRHLNGIGIGVSGPVSFRDGVPVSPPIMPGWDRHPVRDLLARQHNCPVVVDNDVNIMAVGERYGGVARSAENVLFVEIGSGSPSAPTAPGGKRDRQGGRRPPCRPGPARHIGGGRWVLTVQAPNGYRLRRPVSGAPSLPIVTQPRHKRASDRRRRSIG
ncbi:ROK family protein [Planotetraspora sp. A-T 1434]|uniref:ROK family protein n=1 Tax=Planotetraspora sp. A-T 1434 TaxID=2979219 RepID=UPI0021BEB50C|nr:ROK family protein [Planotetraspora sp. A-T 1434]MCT9934671.1 ROK family protein [Planotetraspora sp. A-T 1434]